MRILVLGRLENDGPFGPARQADDIHQEGLSHPSYGFGMKIEER